jgi:hypothetical protein
MLLCFVNFENETGCDLCPKLGWSMVLRGKHGIDHIHELSEKKRQSDLNSLMIFSVRMT